jgi:hypothetical protein
MDAGLRRKRAAQAHSMAELSTDVSCTSVDLPELVAAVNIVVPQLDLRTRSCSECLMAWSTFANRVRRVTFKWLRAASTLDRRP